MSDQHNKKPNPILEYFEDSWTELKKVTWPTRNQAVRLTLLVLGFCLAAAIVIGGMDALFGYGHQKLLEYADTVVPVSTEETDTSAAQSTPVTAEAGPVTTTTLPVTPVTATTTSTQQ
jgi:preprotein translocase subunit SecE